MSTGRTVNIGQLVARIIFKDDSQGLVSANNRLSAFNARVASTSSRLNSASSSLSRFASSLAVWGLTLTTSSFFATRSFAQVDTAMSKLRGQVGLTQEEIDDMLPSVSAISTEFGLTLASALESLFTITSAGQRGEVALDTLRTAAKGATSQFGTLQDIVKLLIPAMAAYGSDTLSASKVMDQLAATVRLGNLEATRLPPALAPLLGLASQLGIEFGELASAMAVMSRIQPSLQRNSTSLMAVMRVMIKPTTQFTDALEKVGIDASELITRMGSDGLFYTLRRIRNAFGDNSEAFAQAFSGTEDLAAALLFLSGNADESATIIDKVTNAVGDADRTLAEFQGRTQSLITKQLSSFTNVLAKLGQEMFPIVSNILGSLTRWLNHMATELERGNLFMQFFIYWMSLAGPGLMGFSLILKSLTPVIKGASLAMWAFNFAMSKNPVLAIVSAIVIMIGVLAVAVRYWEKIYGFIEGAKTFFFGQLDRHHGKVTSPSRVTVPWTGLSSGPRLSGTVSDEEVSNLPKFASGGLVPGPMGQPLLAMVHGGEYVVPAPTVSQNGISDSSGGNRFGDVYITIEGANQSPEDIASALQESLTNAARAVILSNDTRIHT